MRILSLLAASCVAMAALPAHAEVKGTVNEAIYAYQVMCVNSIGEPKKQQAVIDKLEKSKTIVRIPDAEVKAMFNKPIQGWATQTADKTKMILTYDPAGICALRIEKADEAALKSAFKTQVDAIAKELKGEVIVPVKDKKQKNGNSFTYYEIKTGKVPLAMGLGISTASSKKGDFQHLLTFNLAPVATGKK